MSPKYVALVQKGGLLATLIVSTLLNVIIYPQMALETTNELSNFNLTDAVLGKSMGQGVALCS